MKPNKKALFTTLLVPYLTIWSQPARAAHDTLSPQELLTLKVSGMEAVRTKNLDRALSIFDRYLSYYPNDPQGYFWRALAFENCGRVDQAIDEYQRSLNCEGPVDAVELRNNLANLLVQKGRTAEAETHYKRALEIDARAPEVKLNYAQMLLSQSRLDEAGRLLIDIGPRLSNDPRFCLLQGIFLLKQGRKAEALGWFQKCVATNNSINPSIRNNNLSIEAEKLLQVTR